jgi:hypothetical protein
MKPWLKYTNRTSPIPSDLPATVNLVVPTFGSIRVLVRDVNGAAAKDGWCTLYPADSVISMDRSLPTSMVAEGVAVFRPVGLGAEFEVVFETWYGAKVRRRVLGPTVPGETRTVEIRIGEDHPVLSLRAIDRSGAPLSNETLNVERDDYHIPLTTDADGRVEIHVESRTRLVELQREESGSEARVEVPPDLEPGLHDLGSVVFGGGELLVAGVVVDESGHPVRARLVAGRRRTESDYWPVADLGFSRADGTFEAHGRPELSEPLEIVAEKEGLAALPIPFDRGFAACASCCLPKESSRAA